MLAQAYAPILTQVEVVAVIIAGITGLSLDNSIITFKQDMKNVWSIALDPYKFPPITQLYLKYLMTLLILIRTSTLHITIAFYVVMLWPAVFAERPNLILPWLIVGSARLCVDLIATIAGLYVSTSYGYLKTLWLEFLLVQILNHGPFFYIWLTIYKFRLYLIELDLRRNNLLEEETYEVKTKRKTRQQILSERQLQKVAEEERSSRSRTAIDAIIELIRSKQRSLTTSSLDTLLEIIESQRGSEELHGSQTEDVQDDSDEDELLGEYIKSVRTFRKISSPDLTEDFDIDAESDILDDINNTSQAYFSFPTKDTENSSNIASAEIDVLDKELELSCVKLNSQSEFQPDSNTFQKRV